MLLPNGAAPATAAASAAATVGVNTVVTFGGSFTALSGTTRQTFHFTMIGQNPALGVTTTVNAPIIPVSVDLRNADGSPRFVNGHRLFSDVTPFIAQLVASPLFQNATYSSSNRPTQVQDAIQRAEFFHSASANWHTLLHPIVRRTRVMVLRAGSYTFTLKSDGSCCAHIEVDANTFLSKLLPTTASDTSTVGGAALHAGDFGPHDVTTFFFPNTFLFNSTRTFFFVGLHTFISFPPTVQNGNKEQRFVVNYSSWVSPMAFFNDAFQDITAVSHELAESVNDPFLANFSPWWKAPNGQCDDIIETGDVLEDLANSTFPVRIGGRTYHPQNEALLEWFEFQKPSRALHGDYSYPDERLLTSLSAPQRPGCQ